MSEYLLEFEEPLQKIEEKIETLKKTAYRTGIDVDSSIEELNKQLLANKRLDFEMARLKHCAEQKRLGVTFHPSSPAAQICADIVVANPHGVIPNHQHEIPK